MLCDTVSDVGTRGGYRWWGTYIKPVLKSRVMKTLFADGILNLHGDRVGSSRIAISDAILKTP